MFESVAFTNGYKRLTRFLIAKKLKNLFRISVYLMLFFNGGFWAGTFSYPDPIVSWKKIF